MRTGTSPAGAEALIRLYPEIDVRSVLATITQPTLVLHRRDDRVAPFAWGRAIAAGIPKAKLVEIPGADHLPFYKSEEIVDEIEEFMTGTRHVHEPDRMLATVMFTDIVDSTARASELGDTDWRRLLE